MFKKSTMVFFGIVLVFASCNNRKTPNVSDVSVDFKVLRFEDDLMHLDPAGLKNEIWDLYATYGDFLLLFSQEIIGIGSPENPSYPDFLRQFITDFMINDVYKLTKSTFSDFDPFAQDIKKGLTYFHYYFPNKGVPRLVTYISGFNHSVAVTDSTLGVGLDKYLGADNDYYHQLGFEQYRRYTMRPENITTDAMKALGMTYFIYNDSSDNLINQMLYEGRALYFTKKMVPWQHDTLVFGFTPDELMFCKNNEEQMWTYLIENKKLFSTDQFVIQKFIGEAPFTKEFSSESPGQAAVWLGYRIVNAYMKENRKVTLEELMEMTDYQEILRLSTYQP